MRQLKIPKKQTCTSIQKGTVTDNLKIVTFPKFKKQIKQNKNKIQCIIFMLNKKNSCILEVKQY